ncbi:MAG: extracellular elastinolytic metalloproteinase, partial [Ilumatobacteraceae bacterium]
MLVSPAVLPVYGSVSALDNGRVPAGGVLRVSVPEAMGGKTVVGQLTVDRAVGAGFVTAFGCDDGIPTGADGNVSRSDLNFNGNVSPVSSNRLLVQADDNGDVCFYTSRPAALIVDINAVTFDTGVNSFANRRTDTRPSAVARIEGVDALRVSVPEAVGGKTVVGQLTVDQVTEPGFVTAYGCDDGIPTYTDGAVSRSDLNFDGRLTSVSSNRLIVQADNDGDVCFYTSRPAALIVDVNGVSDAGIDSFANQRTDTRAAANPRVAGGGVLRVSVPGALGGKTVVGQLTVDQVTQAGFVTAYGCDDGIPADTDGGTISRSDLNFDGTV